MSQHVNFWSCGGVGGGVQDDRQPCLFCCVGGSRISLLFTLWHVAAADKRGFVTISLMDQIRQMTCFNWLRHLQTLCEDRSLRGVPEHVHIVENAAGIFFLALWLTAVHKTRVSSAHLSGPEQSVTTWKIPLACGKWHLTLQMRPNLFLTYLCSQKHHPGTEKHALWLIYFKIKMSQLQNGWYSWQRSQSLPVHPFRLVTP